MRRIHLTVMFLGILLLLSASAFGSTLVWSDEFETVSPVLDGNRPNPATWTYDVGGGGFGNGQLEYNTARRENSYIENGNLVLEARREFYQEATTNSFTSARMRTQGRFAFKYGTLEARIKFPDTANGLWPAFWLLGNNFPGVAWPMSGETDIVELGSRAGIDAGLQNKKMNAAIHYDNDGTYEFAAMWIDAAVDLSLDYHLYKIEWTPTQMTWYLDGVPYWSFDITADYLREFHQPAFPILNIAIGGWNYVQIMDPGAITAPFPAKMYVDWIRLESNANTEVFLGDDSKEDGNFGIFTETTPVNNSLIYGDSTDPEFQYGNEAALFIWKDVAGNATMTEATPPTPSEGSVCWSFDSAPGTSWYGIGVMVPNFRNMKNYSDGYLHFDMATMTTDELKVGIKSSVGDESWLYLNVAGEQFGLVRDGDWHEVIIPLNRFSNIDFQTVHQMFMFACGASTSATNVSFDNIWWEPSVPKQIPEMGNFGVFTENAAHKNAGEFVLGTDGRFLIWENTLVPRTKTPYEGTDSMSLQSATGLTWFGCAFTPNIKYNLTAFRYPESKLHFALKTNSLTAFRVGMKSGNVGGIGQKWITFQNGSDPYGFVRDGAWHVVEIPMSDFTTEVDLFEVSQFFEILGTSGSISDIEFDDICFTGGGSPLAGEGGNIPPSVSITSPVSGTFFDPGDNVTIVAEANDADGTVTKVEFLHGLNLLGEDLSSPYTYTWNSIPEGAYVFRAKATDNNDVSRTSLPVTIYVGTPVLTTIGVSPSITTVEEGKIKRFTGRGFDQFGVEFPADVSWSVSGGGVIDENGFFAAVDVGGPYTVTAVEAVNGVLSGTASVSVFAGGLCAGEPANGDYTWEAPGVNPTVTFIPSGPGIGNTLLIFYYSKNPGGAFPGYITSPGTPYPILGANPGETIYFYHTYNVPGGEHTTFDDIQSFQVGNCPPIIASDFDGNGKVDFSDFARLANYWMKTNCDVSNNYCEGADHVRDGDVDIYDLEVLVYSWLKGIPGPSVSITSPVNGSAFNAGDDVTIVADANGTVIKKVEFFEGVNLLGEDLSSPYSFTWYSIPEGTYVLTAKATDSDGLSSISEPVTIRVGTSPIVANGGFELGTGADANGWTENALGNTASIVRSSDSPYSGSYSMLATVNWLSGTGTKAEIYQTTATGSITPGLNYDFGFVAKGTLGPGAVAWYQIQWLDTDGSHGGGVKGTTPLGNIWGTLTTTYKEYGATYTVPAGADAAMISIRLEGGAFSGSTGQMYIDDVYLY